MYARKTIILENTAPDGVLFTLTRC